MIKTDRFSSRVRGKMVTLQEMIKSFENLSEDEQESLLEILYQYRAKAKQR